MHKSAKILTRPVIIASNNQPANLVSSAVKNVAGGVTSANSPTVNFSMVPAAVTIGFTPVISKNDVVNLQINITLDQWQDLASETNNTQAKRKLNTNVSVKSGSIIVLGGLIKEVATRSKSSIPFLDKVPILGSFVANRYKNTTRDQLFILLRATVIAPRTQGGMGKATKSASNYMMQQFEDYEDAFSNLKDPITRWFFNEEADRASVQLDGKMTDLANPKNPNVEMAQLEQIDQFFKPQYDANPLGVKWLTDEAHDAQPANKKLVELGNKLEKVVNPFSNRLAL